MGVWADVFYAKNEAKEIYGDFGYSADIYGGVLGFDYTAACGGTLGAALTVGTADADSEGGVLVHLAQLRLRRSSPSTLRKDFADRACAFQG